MSRQPKTGIYLSTIAEVFACASFLVVMFILLVFGSAIIPYQPSMHSESVWNEGGQ